MVQIDLVALTRFLSFMLLLFVLFGFRRWRRRRRRTHYSFTLSRKRISRRNRIFSLDLIRICRRDGPVTGVEGRTKRRNSGHGHRRVTSEVWSRRRRTRADSGAPANVVSRWQASVNRSLLCFFPVIILKWFNTVQVRWFVGIAKWNIDLFKESIPVKMASSYFRQSIVPNVSFFVLKLKGIKGLQTKKSQF